MVDAVLERRQAVARYLKGESATAICQSLGHSREWLYKWVRRHHTSGAAWADERSRRPHTARQLAAPLVTAIVMARRSLQRRQLFCGAPAIAWELADPGVTPPSLRTISRVVDARCAVGHLVAPGHARASAGRQQKVFYGSRTHPRGLGPLIRLCLAMGIEPWFIPPSALLRPGAETCRAIRNCNEQRYESHPRKLSRDPQSSTDTD
jgi:hypothetical protein